MAFRNREDAGRQLGQQLLGLRDERPVVLGLPRGGVPVASEVARALDAPLDVWVVRKLGAPSFPEYGLGAVAEGGQVYLDREAAEEVGVTEEELDALIRRKSGEVDERVARLRAGRPRIPTEGRTVILIDDGIATGGTMRSAIEALWATRPRKVVLATPVAAAPTLEKLRPLVSELVCLLPVEDLVAIGGWYEDFRQTSDEEVQELLARAPRAAAAPRRERAESLEVEIPADGSTLRGALVLPPGAVGLVLFAHGSGSSRFSPRNRKVAETLQGFGLATLLFDLLTEEEEAFDSVTGELRFDIGLLARRLVLATDWTRREARTARLPIGYFGSSTGAAAALVGAALRPEVVRAVVSRGGRPDLAGGALARVRAPTLLLVGGEDTVVIELNQAAADRLRAPHQLTIIPGATHLFEERGALERVARLAGAWFAQHLAGAAPQPWVTR